MKFLAEKMKAFVEIKVFGVCAFFGEILGIATSHIRFFFIYLTFLTFGSPVFIYLSLAFLINISRYIRNRKRNPVWDF